MQAIIPVNSSSRPEPYTIKVSVEVECVSIICDCPAGKLGKYCKHKEALVMGDERILFDEGQRGSFLQVYEAISASKLPRLFAELKEASQSVEEAKKQVKSLKAKIARSMANGIE